MQCDAMLKNTNHVLSRLQPKLPKVLLHADSVPGEKTDEGWIDARLSGSPAPHGE